MNVRAKFDGGKQINRSQSGSWQARCAGAGLRMNEGPTWGPATWGKIVSAPCETFTKVAESKFHKVIKDRKRKSRDDVKIQRKKAKRARQVESKQGRDDYSRHDGGKNATDIVTDISPDQLHALMREYYLANVKVSEAKCEELKLKTAGQGKCDNSLQVWLAERRKRITASNVGCIAKRRATTKVNSTVKKLLYTKFEGNTATKWGILQEESTNTRYLEEKRKSPEISTSQSGLVISLANPWLAASPDGLVYDPTENLPHGIVEFKNPYSVRNSTLREAAINKKGFCLVYNETTDKLTLKEHHDYFYQIQCTLYCTQCQWCDLVVRTKDIHVERIYYQPEFWLKEVLPKLKAFYFTAILPELSSPLGVTAIREPTDSFKKEWGQVFKLM